MSVNTTQPTPEHSVSSIDSFMKLINSTLMSSSSSVGVKPGSSTNIAFIPINRNEYGAVPYDSAEKPGFIKISQTADGTQYYAQPTTLPSIKPVTSDTPDELTGPTNPSTLDNSNKTAPKSKPRDIDDSIFHIYIGSLSIIGLLILFRIMQKG